MTRKLMLKHPTNSSQGRQMLRSMAQVPQHMNADLVTKGISTYSYKRNQTVTHRQAEVGVVFIAWV